MVSISYSRILVKESLEIYVCKNPTKIFKIFKKTYFLPLIFKLKSYSSVYFN